MDNEVADFLRYCRLERRLADLTCKAYERDVRACVAFLRERGIEELAEVRAPQLREFLAAFVSWFADWWLRRGARLYAAAKKAHPDRLERGALD